MIRTPIPQKIIIFFEGWGYFLYTSRMPRRPPVVPIEMRNTSLNEPVGAIQANFLADAPFQPLGGAHMGRVTAPLSGPRDELRHKILKMSLFPNIYNRSTLESHS